MRRQKLLWELYPSYLLIIGLSLAAALWFGERHLAEVAYRQKADNLESLARLAGRQLEALVPLQHDGAGLEESIHELCQELGDLSGVRLTVVNSRGKVVGDSREAPSRMEDHADRAEIKAALEGQAGKSDRMSRTLRQKMMYVAVPLALPGEGGAVRASVAMVEVGEVLRVTRFRLILAGIVVVMVGGGLSIVISRRIVRPLRDIRDGAERFADGDLESRLSAPPSKEMGSLADAMNRMASQLNERLKTAVRQRNETEAVLASMVEGVIAIDTEKNIIRLNQAASSLLGIDSTEVKGKNIFEVVRNTALLDFISDTLAAEEAREGEISFHAGEERFLQVHGSMLKDARGMSIGALVVLNDVTRIRHLESVRREFVLNASHEIRTPVTSIKGFVETLLEGALEDRENAERFLGIIARHADRLNAIVDDLLDLSEN